MADGGATYRDGVGVERCAGCLRPMRDRHDEPLASVRWSVLEAAIRAGVCLPSNEELRLELQQALGLNLEQIQAREQLEEHEDGYGHGV